MNNVNVRSITTQRELIDYMQNLMRTVSVHISLETFLKTQYFILQCGPEISGLGAVRRANNTFFVDEVFILEQPVTPVSTDLTAGISRLVTELMKKDQDDYVAALKFWWHSHVKMRAEFSESIDLPTIDRLGSTGMMDYLISFVANQFGQYSARLDLFKPFRLTIEHVPVMVDMPTNQVLLEQCAAEIKKNIKVGTLRSILPKFLGGQRVVHPAEPDFGLSVDASSIGTPENVQAVVSEEEVV